MARILALSLFLIAGCDDLPAAPPQALRAPSDPEPVAAPDTTDVQGVRAAVATLAPVGGSSAEGRVTVRDFGDARRVLVRVTGLVPDRHYALQVLLGRSCDADPDQHLGAELGVPHGSPFLPEGQRHLGDLGSVRADDSRVGRYDRFDTVLPLVGTSSAVGRAVVLRAERDDGTTQPAGRAGDVIACGVLEARS